MGLTNRWAMAIAYAVVALLVIIAGVRQSAPVLGVVVALLVLAPVTIVVALVVGAMMDDNGG